jgi:acetyl esterase/lipase
MRRLQPLADRLKRTAAITEAVGDISVRWHGPAVPRADPVPALLWIHGGGMILGNAAQDDAFCRHVADALGIVVAAVDYRLAPEHPFPVPLEDCHDALVWLAGREHVDADRIAIGGGSAGGGLAAGLALLARERGAVAPVFQLLVYPMLDDRTVTRTDLDERHYRLWNNKSNRFGWASYLGQAPGSDSVSELAAPARAEDLTGLPPAWIGVGSLDLFLDEDTTYAKRLRQAGVDCHLDIVDGAFHGFDRVAAKKPVAQAFLATQVDALVIALDIEPRSRT